MLSDADLLAIQYRTLFVTTCAGRIERENDPDRSSGPRFWLGGCSSGNLAGVRFDVAEHITAGIMELAAAEPPFHSTQGHPVHLERFIELLSGQETIREQKLGVVYKLPHGVDYRHDVELIGSDNRDGERLYAVLSERGLPAGLKQMGFRDAADFWPPWCVALHDGEVASVAFSARISETGAELGVATVPALRGRGYAAAATAAWSRLQELQSRALFYSTDQTNRPSQRLIGRLDLHRLGASLRLI
jgi:hypothetical protein